MTTDAPRRVGSYEILEPLGRGGMGTVYLARDVRLDRVARRQAGCVASLPHARDCDA